MSIDFNTFTDKSGVGRPFGQKEDIPTSRQEDYMKQYPGKTKMVFASLILIFLFSNMVFLGYIHNQIIRRIDEKSDLVLNCDPVVLADYQKDAEVFNNLYRELKAMKK